MPKSHITEEEYLSAIKTVRLYLKQIHTEVYFNEVFDAPIEKWDLSVRATIFLREAGIHTLRKLWEIGPHEVLKLRNYGKRTASELEEIFRKNGLIWE